MTAPGPCTSCGLPLDSEVPGGLCPACLLKLGLAAGEPATEIGTPDGATVLGPPTDATHVSVGGARPSAAATPRGSSTPGSSSLSGSSADTPRAIGPYHLLQELGEGGEILRAGFSPAGRILATRSYRDSSPPLQGLPELVFTVWDSSNGRERFSLPGLGSITAFAFSPDGRRIVTAGRLGSTYGKLIVWSAETGAKLQELPDAPSAVSSEAFSADGARLAITGRSFLNVLDAATGSQVASVAADDQMTTFDRAVAFSPKGSIVAESNVRHGVRAWSATDGKLLWSFKPDQSVREVGFNRDGRLVAVVDDRTLRVLDPATGRELGRLAGHSGPVNALAFSPDGTRVASGVALKRLRAFA